MPIAKFVTIQRCRNKMSERAGRQLRSIFYELLMSGVINHCVCIVSKELFMTRLPLFFCFVSHGFHTTLRDKPKIIVYIYVHNIYIYRYMWYKYLGYTYIYIYNTLVVLHIELYNNTKMIRISQYIGRCVGRLFPLSGHIYIMP